MARAWFSRCAPGLVALCTGVSVAGSAAAAPVIAWDAPAGCPEASALTAEMARHVEPAVMAAESGSVLVRVRQDGERWTVAVAIEADGGALERMLAVESCEAAVRAAAFVIALAVNPGHRELGGVVPPPPPEAPVTASAAAGTTEEPVGTAAPQASAETRPEPGLTTAAPLEATSLDPRDRVAPPPRSSRPRSIRVLAQLGPAMQVGMLPVNAGLSASAGLLWPRLRVVFGYTRWFTAEVRHAAERPYGAAFSVHAGHVRVGPVLRAGPLELPLHVGVELGGLRGAGTGGDWNYTADTLWAAVMVGAGLAWAPRRLRGYAALGVLAEVALSLHSPQFVFDGDLPVHRVGAVAFRGFLALEARFP